MAARLACPISREPSAATTGDSRIMARIGVLALARPTFDVPFAEEIAAEAFAALDRAGHTLVGTRELLFDAAAAERAVAVLEGERLDLLLILQVTFTDATMTVRIAAEAAA